jgi:hypothetical protein
MKRIIRLTESDLARIVRRVINEQAPTPNTAAKKPSTIQLSYGNITVSIRYDANQDYVYLTGASKMPDGNLRGLKGTSNVSTNIDEMVSKFMGGNGLQGNFRVAGHFSKRHFEIFFTVVM